MSLVHRHQQWSLHLYWWLLLKVENVSFHSMEFGLTWDEKPSFKGEGLIWIAMTKFWLSYKFEMVYLSFDWTKGRANNSPRKSANISATIILNFVFFVLFFYLEKTPPNCNIPSFKPIPFSGNMGVDSHPPALPWPHFQWFQGLDWRSYAFPFKKYFINTPILQCAPWERGLRTSFCAMPFTEFH